MLASFLGVPVCEIIIIKYSSVMNIIVLFIVHYFTSRLFFNPLLKYMLR